VQAASQPLTVAKQSKDNTTAFASFNLHVKKDLAGDFFEITVGEVEIKEG
jgi:hypothetical protein